MDNPMQGIPMNSSMVLSITTFVYAAAAIAYLFFWVFKREGSPQMGAWLTVIGLMGNTLGILLRWKESYALGFGHAPFSNLYESLVFFAWAIAILFLVIDRKYRIPMVGVFALFFSFLTMAYASLSPNVMDQIQPLVPALKSNWLIAHVITCFIGYAAFAVACGTSFMYLLKEDSEGGAGFLPSCDDLDALSYQMVMFGFLFLTIGIITGSVWANTAWGRYWGWDPKETWSLITWFIYATLLHARNMRGWRGKKTAWLSIIGFAAVIFTYLGVNFLLSGLHSYGRV